MPANKMVVQGAQKRPPARATTQANLEGGAEATASVVVVARIRPKLPKEESERDGVETYLDGQTVGIFNGRDKKQYTLDQVFDSRWKGAQNTARSAGSTDSGTDKLTQAEQKKQEAAESQAKFFAEFGRNLVVSSLKGYNVCVFAYGHTGSGKTYTMLGDAAGSGRGAAAGLLPRFLTELFSEHEDVPRPTSWRCSCEFFEVYNEQIRDLLQPAGQSHQTKKRVHCHPKHGARIEGLTMSVVDSAEEVMELLSFGNQMRTVAATTMNSRSSRSHAFFNFKYEQVEKEEQPAGPPAVRGKERRVTIAASATPDNAEQSAAASAVTFVDLAGREERERLGNHPGALQYKEMCFINTSLFHLAHLITKISAGGLQSNNLSDFRNSKVTMLLSQALQGNSRTAVVATLSPLQSAFEDSMSTLNFAASAKKIQTKPVVNSLSATQKLAELENEVHSLQVELAHSKTSNTEKEQELLSAQAWINYYKRSWEEDEERQARWPFWPVLGPGRDWRGSCQCRGSAEFWESRPVLVLSSPDPWGQKQEDSNALEVLHRIWGSAPWPPPGLERRPPDEKTPSPFVGLRFGASVLAFVVCFGAGLAVGLRAAREGQGSRFWLHIEALTSSILWRHTHQRAVLMHLVRIAIPLLILTGISRMQAWLVEQFGHKDTQKILEITGLTPKNVVDGIVEYCLSLAMVYVVMVSMLFFVWHVAAEKQAGFRHLLHVSGLSRSAHPGFGLSGWVVRWASFSREDNATLFVAGFGSSAIFGTFVGSMADKHGRRRFAALYCVLYCLSCLTKHFKSFEMLMVGRITGGIATSLLFSVLPVSNWIACRRWVMVPSMLLGPKVSPQPGPALRAEKPKSRPCAGKLRAAHGALLQAVSEGNDFKVQEVLQTAEFLLERTDGEGHTVLHLAAMRPPREAPGAVWVLSYLQHCRADLEARNLLGETPLVMAVRAALAHAPKGKGRSVEEEVRQEWLSVVSCLLEGRADPNAADDLNEETPLMEAACQGSHVMCHLLLSFRADVSCTTGTGATAIDFASSEGHGPLVKHLTHVLSDCQRSQAREAGAKTLKPSELPFATSLGFTTWSAGRSWQPPCPPKPSEADSSASGTGTQSEAPSFSPGIFGPGAEVLRGINFHTYADKTFADSRLPFSSGSRSGARPESEPKAPWAEHLRTLGLPGHATADEVRAAYRRLALQYHPDKNQGSEEAAAKFREVKRAYELLSASF
ncbi:unnamed protein product [Effrenium voratum]|uniref:Uncharacterized protein n=1 Tax=Effrenium voratum TaxID=2562239 RepID=A0AA36JBX1_9DINO|nr:unnamed protein product [Effrenium voratum]